MTNNGGPTEWGPVTNRFARIRTIADCICTQNQIKEEWLMRDNGLLVQALGFDIFAVAHEMATQKLQQQQLQKQQKTTTTHNLIDSLSEKRNQVMKNCIGTTDASKLLLKQNFKTTTSPSLSLSSLSLSSTQGTQSSLQNVHAFIHQLYYKLWLQREFLEEDDNNNNNANNNNMLTFYDYRVTSHLTCGRELYGIMELQSYLQNVFLKGLNQSSVAIQIHNIAHVPYLSIHSDALDVAVRWSLTGIHTYDSIMLGKASQTPVYILGSTHYRIIKGRIREEWTVFDELALLEQIATQRILNHESNN